MTSLDHLEAELRKVRALMEQYVEEFDPSGGSLALDAINQAHFIVTMFSEDEEHA